jgi:hypothetical protein
VLIPEGAFPFSLLGSTVLKTAARNKTSSRKEEEAREKYRMKMVVLKYNYLLDPSEL